MKHKNYLIIIALALSTGLTRAQPPMPPSKGSQDQPTEKRHPRPPLLKALDTDGDGIISASEIANAAESLKKLDKNGDGQITPDELRPPPPPKDAPKGNQHKKPQKPADPTQQPPTNGAPADKAETPSANDAKKDHHPSPLMEALDTDGDGTLSAEEIADASKSLLTLDKNGDGKLTPDEYRPSPPDGGKKQPDKKNAPKR